MCFFGPWIAPISIVGRIHWGSRRRQSGPAKRSPEVLVTVIYDYISLDTTGGGRNPASPAAIKNHMNSLGFRLSCSKAIYLLVVFDHGDRKPYEFTRFLIASGDAGFLPPPVPHPKKLKVSLLRSALSPRAPFVSMLELHAGRCSKSKHLSERPKRVSTLIMGGEGGVTKTYFCVLGVVVYLITMYH